MGIYPVTRYLDVNTGADLAVDSLHYRDAWYEEHNDFTGVLRYRLVTAEPLLDIRDDCFCCSCTYNSDPHCRNHGFAGRRPCSTHGLPGYVDDDGIMPMSVEAIRALRSSAEV